MGQGISTTPRNTIEDDGITACYYLVLFKLLPELTEAFQGELL